MLRTPPKKNPKIIQKNSKKSEKILKKSKKSQKIQGLLLWISNPHTLFGSEQLLGTNEQQKGKHGHKRTGSFPNNVHLADDISTFAASDWPINQPDHRTDERLFRVPLWNSPLSEIPLADGRASARRISIRSK